MKKALSLLFGIVLILCITACGGLVNHEHETPGETESASTSLSELSDLFDTIIARTDMSESEYEEWEQNNIIEEELEITYLSVGDAGVIPDFITYLANGAQPDVYSVLLTHAFTYTHEGFDYLKENTSATIRYGDRRKVFGDLSQMTYEDMLSKRVNSGIIVDFTGHQDNVKMVQTWEEQRENSQNRYFFVNNTGYYVIRIVPETLDILVIPPDAEVQIYSDLGAVVFLPYPKTLQDDFVFVFEDELDWYIEDRGNGRVSPALVHVFLQNDTDYMIALPLKDNMLSSLFEKNDDVNVYIRQIAPEVRNATSRLEIYNPSGFDENADVLFFNVAIRKLSIGDESPMAHIVYRQTHREAGWCLYSGRVIGFAKSPTRVSAGKVFYTHNDPGDVILENFNALYAADSYPAGIDDPMKYYVEQEETEIRYGVGFMAEYSPYAWRVIGEAPEHLTFK